LPGSPTAEVQIGIFRKPLDLILGVGDDATGIIVKPVSHESCLLEN